MSDSLEVSAVNSPGAVICQYVSMSICPPASRWIPVYSTPDPSPPISHTRLLLRYVCPACL